MRSKHRHLLIPLLASSMAMASLCLAEPALTAADRAAAGAPLKPIATTPPDRTARVYIVQFEAPPAVAEPQVRAAAGLDPLPGREQRRFAQRAADRKHTGRGKRPRRFDAGAPDVRRYADQLTNRHDAVLHSVGATDAKIYSYRYSLNGFAARLTPAQARRLAARKDVRRVWEDRSKSIQTNASSAFLGLTNSNTGLRRALKLSGEDVVIGVIDTGIAPNHPSLGDKEPPKLPKLCRGTWGRNSLLGLWLCKRFRNRDSTLAYSPLPGWAGACEQGEGFRSTYCNNKLIGARFYKDGFLSQFDMHEAEFDSPRDAAGHGTHVATIAAGNFVEASLAGEEVGKIGGVAPRARVAVYKACWLDAVQTGDEPDYTCSIADLVSAIEDAVADGVDIINYSLGSEDGITDADDLALLAASDAGILTVAAAGNEGPQPGSLLSPATAPWVLAVGASSRTGDRFLQAVRVNSPAAVRDDYPAFEAIFTPLLHDIGTLTRRLVLVDDNFLGSFDGASGTTFDGCERIVNTAELEGQIALIQRGGCTFETKIRNAQVAGADGVVVFSDSGAPIPMSGRENSVRIPAVMISLADGRRLVEQLEDNERVEVTLGVFMTARDPGNQMQGFSSRGPNQWVPKLLKPDVTAPGMDILAGHSPDAINNLRREKFQYRSGSSMAAPHVAGVAALLKQAHPDWSPAALRSALVTTARQNIRKEDGDTAADPFDFGGGHIVPNEAVHPGLVFDAGTNDFDAFLCGLDAARKDVDCAGLVADGYSMDASDLNQPSIALDDLVSSRTIRRRVTNVGPPGQFTATAQAPTTIDVDISPPFLSLGTGESADVDITFSTTGSTFDAWQFGSLTWMGAESVVRLPFAIMARAFGAPLIVRESGASGSTGFAFRVGYTGNYQARLYGLEASGQTQPEYIKAQLINSVKDDPDGLYEFVQPTEGLPADNVRRIPLKVPEGTRYLRVALTSEEVSKDADLDLYLFSCPGLGTCTGEAHASTNEGSDELVAVIPQPGESFITPGDYYVDVHGYHAPAGTATFKLFVWTVGADRSNAAVSGPSHVNAGTDASVDVNWDGLEPGLHLGLLLHTDGSTVLDQTVIEINAP